MISDISLIFIYIALFGLSDIFLRVYHIESIQANVLYYLFILAIAILFHIYKI